MVFTKVNHAMPCVFSLENRGFMAQRAGRVVSVGGLT